MRHLYRPKPAEAVLVAFAAALAAAQHVLGGPPPEFERDVRPVLDRHCFQCHGPDKQKGGLRLDQKPSALKGGDSGDPAVVPGDAGRSHVLKVIASADPDERMP